MYVFFFAVSTICNYMHVVSRDVGGADVDENTYIIANTTLNKEKMIKSIVEVTEPPTKKYPAYSFCSTTMKTKRHILR